VGGAAAAIGCRSRIEVVAEAVAADGVQAAPVCGKRRAETAGGSGGLEGGDSVGSVHAASACGKRRAATVGGLGGLEGGGSTGAQRWRRQRARAASTRHRHAGSSDRWLRWARGRQQHGRPVVAGDRRGL
jgi:hypothetical protein